MINKKEYISNEKFAQLSNANKQAILKLDEQLTKNGYVFIGKWRDDLSDGGYNSIFELVDHNSQRKNLITLRPMSNNLTVEVCTKVEHIVDKRTNRKY